MRFLRTARHVLAAARSAFDRWQIVRWTGVALTVAATTAGVLFASFVAVALGLT
jgi:hypothetical protein